MGRLNRESRNGIAVLLFIVASAASQFTSPSDVRGDCQDKPDGIYPTGHCSTFFLECSGGRTIKQNCSNGLWFNPQSLQCDYREQIVACQETFSCIGREDGVYSEGCSSLFWYCRAGQLLHSSCPTGTFFNVESRKCDYRSNIGACGGESKTSSTTTRRSTRVTSTMMTPTESSLQMERDSTEVPYGHTYPTYAPRQRISGTVSKTPLAESSAGTACAGKEDGSHAISMCSAQYVLCWAGTGEVMSCQEGLFFNEAKSACDYPLNVIGCNKVNVVESPTAATVSSVYKGALPSSDSSSSLPIPRQPIDFDCSSRTDGSYSRGCIADFYQCVAGVAYHSKCQDGLVFDDLTKACDYPEICSAPHTTVHDSSTQYFDTPSTATPVAAEPTSFDCSSRVDGLYSDGCVQTYYTCSSGATHVSQCPIGLVFDGVTQNCDYMEKCGQPRPLDESTPYHKGSPSHETQINIQPSFDCSSRVDGGYGTTCSHEFVQCVSGIAYSQKCPVDLVFIEKIGACDYPEKCHEGERNSTSVDTAWTTPSTTTSTTVQPETPTLPLINYDCLNREDGLYSIGCSRIFVHCASGITLTQLCPDYLVFVQSLSRCDFPSNCDGSPSEISQSTSSPYNPSMDNIGTTSMKADTVSSHKDEQSGILIDCTTLPDGLYSSGCTSAFVQCASSSAYPLQCPDELVFDKRVSKCVWSSECSSTSTDLPIVSIPVRPSDAPSAVFEMYEKEETTIDAPLPQMNKGGTLCTGTGRRTMGKCSSGFVQCIGGKLIARRCPGQSLFDEKIGLCVYDLEECEMDVNIIDEEVSTVPVEVPAIVQQSEQEATTSSIGYGTEAVQSTSSNQEETMYQNGGYKQVSPIGQQSYQTQYQQSPPPQYETAYPPQNGQYEYQDVSSYPSYSSFDDSLPLSPSIPSSSECSIGSFRRVSACSSSFDFCSPTALQWIRKACGKSHRFDSSTTKCRPIFEVRECDEPLSSYIPPPAQSPPLSVYSNPTTSFDRVAHSGKEHHQHNVVDSFSGGYQSGRMGSNPFVAVGNTGTFYAEDGFRWIGSTWNEGGNGRREHRHQNDGGYVIVSGNPFGAGRHNTVLDDEWNGRKERRGSGKWSSLREMRGKRVKNVVDEFKGHVSHFDAPLEVVNPFAVKRGDGHRRRGRGRKNCHGERKHRRREEREEDEEECEEKEPKNRPTLNVEKNYDDGGEIVDGMEGESREENREEEREEIGEGVEKPSETIEEDEETGDALRGEEEENEEEDGEDNENMNTEVDETNVENDEKALEESGEEKENEKEIDLEILPDFVNEDNEKNEIEENKEESAPSSDQSGQFEEIDEKIEERRNDEDEEEEGEEEEGDEESMNGGEEEEEEEGNDETVEKITEENAEKETSIDDSEEKVKDGLNEDEVDKEFDEDGESEGEKDVESPESIENEEKIEKIEEEEEETGDELRGEEERDEKKEETEEKEEGEGEGEQSKNLEEDVEDEEGDELRGEEERKNGDEMNETDDVEESNYEEAKEEIKTVEKTENNEKQSEESGNVLENVREIDPEVMPDWDAENENNEIEENKEEPAAPSTQSGGFDEIDEKIEERRTEDEEEEEGEEKNGEIEEKQVKDIEMQYEEGGKTDVELPESIDDEKEEGREEKKEEEGDNDENEDDTQMDSDDGDEEEEEEEEKNEDVNDPEKPESIDNEERGEHDNEKVDSENEKIEEGQEREDRQRRRRRSVYDESTVESSHPRRLSLPRSSRLHRSRFSRLCVSQSIGQSISIGQCRQDFVYCKSARRPVVAACPVGDLFDALVSNCIPTEICGVERSKMDSPSIIRPSTSSPTFPLEEGEKPTMPTKIENTVTQSTTVVTEDNTFFSCDGRSDGAFPSSPCSSNYFVCSASIKYSYSCPDGLIFDSSSDRCGWAKDVVSCGVVSPVTEKTSNLAESYVVRPESTTVSSSTLASPTQSPMHVQFDCGVKNGGFAIDCKGGFVMCSNGEASLMRCPHSLTFDEETQACQYPVHVASCGLSPVVSSDTVYTPPSATTTTTTTAAPQIAVEIPVNTPINKDVCIGSSSDLRGSTRDCASSFVLCEEGKVKTAISCAPGTFFDEKMKRCDYREIACAGGWTGEVERMGDSSRVDESEYSRGPSRISRPYRPSMPIGVEKIEKKEEERREMERDPIVVPSKVEPAKEATCDWKGAASSGSCSSQFIICSNGRPEVFDCASQLVFDISTSACSYPQFVTGCPQIEESAPLSSSPSTVSDDVIDYTSSEYSRDETPSTTTVRPLLPVKDGEHTNYKFEATGDHCTFHASQPSFPLNFCSMTYGVCTPDGMTYRTNCTFGFLFDSVIRHCVPAEHCGQSYLKDIAGSIPSPSISSIHNSADWNGDNRCVGINDGKLLAATHCSPEYIKCEKESVTIERCPGPAEVFSSLTDRCVLRAQMAECSSTKGSPAITRPKPPSSSYPAPLSPPSHRGSRIRGGLSIPTHLSKFDARTFCTTKESDGLYRNPENCAGIVQCFGGEAFSYPSCDPGLFFNEIDGQCDYASNVPECDAQANSISFDGSSVSCKGQPHGGHLADDSDCSIYYRCVWGTLERLSCPPGTVFNPRLSVCDYAHQVPHCQKQ